MGFDAMLHLKLIKSYLESCENSMSLLMLVLKICAHVFCVQLLVDIYDLGYNVPKNIIIDVENFIKSHKIVIIYNQQSTRAPSKGNMCFYAQSMQQSM